MNVFILFLASHLYKFGIIVKRIRKGLWVVLFGLGVFFTPGLTFVLAEGSIPNDLEEAEQKKDKKTKKNIIAIFDINPRKLNAKSKGKWITAYIELPKDYDPHDIIIGEIVLNGVLSPEVKPINIADRDNNGVLDLMIKFDRSSVIESLEASQFFEMTISGKLINGIKFKGNCILDLKNQT
jgi:hypothetical protein